VGGSGQTTFSNRRCWLRKRVTAEMPLLKPDV
jgi:hypothetical protein